jgi:5-formyltetrahydrofolate cyclo-ligase
MEPSLVSAWRREQRVRLIELRESIAPPQRREWGEAITRRLVGQLSGVAGRIVGFCWPFRGEHDVRHAIRHFRDLGAVAALPAVVAKGTPLQFRKWWPGAPMRPGVFGIPVPEGTDILRPDIVFAPMNGFDAEGYRLGYGGGYFDRTLASLTPRPLAIGIAHEILRLPTIHPQPHDIPMDFVVTEAGVYQLREGRLALMRDGARISVGGASPATSLQQRGIASRGSDAQDADPQS